MRIVWFVWVLLSVIRAAGFGEMGPWEVARFEEPDHDRSVAYYPAVLGSDVLPKAPVVFLLPERGSTEAEEYETMLRFLASRGVVAIYVRNPPRKSVRRLYQALEEMTGREELAPYLDRRYLGVLGHGTGGGETFAILRDFSRIGWGGDGRFLMALDPGFAPEMTTERLERLPADTRVVFQRYEDPDHPNGTDPRIPLSEYALLRSVSPEDRDYQVVRPARHRYPQGRKDPDRMSGTLEPLGALMALVFEGNVSAEPTALERGSDDPYGSGLQPVRPRKSYRYRCDSHANRAQILEIDYCGAWRAAKRYPPPRRLRERPTEPMAPPAYLETVRGAAFGNAITRITDRSRQTANAQPYPKVQAWNSDMTLLRLGYRIYRTRDYREIRATRRELIDGSMTEMRWSTVEPRIFYALSDRGDRIRFVRIRVEKDRLRYRTLISWPKTRFEEIRMGPWEGNIDFLTRRVVFSARRRGKRYLTAILYDLQKGTTRIHDLKRIPWVRLDWISISPLGDQILINWEADPKNPDPDYRSQIWQYDTGFRLRRILARQGNHGDMGLDALGREVYVQFEYGDDRGIWRYDLRDGKRHRLLPDKYDGGHLSCRNYQRPGWCYLSTRKEGFREVFALRLEGRNRVERFAQTHTGDEYAEGIPSPDGTRILFASSWDGMQKQVESYVVRVPKKTGKER